MRKTAPTTPWAVPGPGPSTTATVSRSTGATAVATLDRPGNGHDAGEELPTISVSGVAVTDLTHDELIDLAARPVVDRPRLVYALHVGGLNALCDTDYRRALANADLVYADGAAVVMLARLAGATRIERAATTDVGTPLLQLIGERLGRTPRVAIVGGPPGLAARAGQVLEERTGATTVLAHHGYFNAREERDLLTDLRAARPDVVLVGLGCPHEAIWSEANRHLLPPALVLTCGGWFGFLTGEESRAPELLRSSGMEWSYRLLHDFRRLRSRYALGAVITASAVPAQLAYRRSQR